MDKCAQTFRLAEIDLPADRSKRVALLCRTDYLIGAVQIIRKGGENNLHSHKHLDGMWTVLSGKARFYGEGDIVIGVLEAHEGILIPRGFKYWFECASDDEPLVILQVESSDIPLRNKNGLQEDRVDHAPKKPSFENGIITN